MVFPRQVATVPAHPFHVRSAATAQNARMSNATLTGRCHCGRITFRLDVPPPERLVRCTCSYCSKVGALRLYCRPDQLHVTTQDGADGIYRWNTRLVAHHACTHCSCVTWSDSPAFEQDGKWDGTTRRMGVNARLLDGIDAAEIPVDVIDGKNLW